MTPWCKCLLLSNVINKKENYAILITLCCMPKHEDIMCMCNFVTSLFACCMHFSTTFVPKVPLSSLRGSTPSNFAVIVESQIYIYIYILGGRGDANHFWPIVYIQSYKLYIDGRKVVFNTLIHREFFFKILTALLHMTKGPREKII